MGNGKGRGVAFVESFGTPTAEVVEVTMTDRGIRIDKVWVAADVGKVMDPVNFENQVQGGVIWGLGHAINCELTYAKGRGAADQLQPPRSDAASTSARSSKFADWRTIPR